MATKSPKLVALKKSADQNKYQYVKPNPKLLESFEVPTLRVGKTSREMMTIDISVPEFTSLCPMTGQPDFATIRISYTPRKFCVESKSLKLYLMGFRQHGSFHESIVAMIGQDLVDLLDPQFLKVVGEFAARGGIPFHPTFSYYSD